MQPNLRPTFPRQPPHPTTPQTKTTAHNRVAHTDTLIKVTVTRSDQCNGNFFHFQSTRPEYHANNQNIASTSSGRFQFTFVIAVRTVPLAQDARFDWREPACDWPLSPRGPQVHGGLLLGGVPADGGRT